jgi:pimeloyl-ACP methyl ester carboxylesterase
MRPRYDSAKAEFNGFESKHGGFVQTPNVRMHYLEWGNPKNTPLVWAHGSFTNSYELAGIAEDLVKEGYYVIAIDYYGHGLTKIPGHEVSLYHVADDIKVLMDVKKIKKAVVGGWSRGGFIATAFYDEDENGKWSIGTGVEKLFNMRNEAEFIGNILRPTQSTLFGASISIIEPRIVYRNLRVPMLILDPVSDPDILPHQAENAQLKSQHPDLIVHKVYENTGHNIHFEKPAMFVRDLGTFLKIVKKHSAR